MNNPTDGGAVYRVVPYNSGYEKWQIQIRKRTWWVFCRFGAPTHYWSMQACYRELDAAVEELHFMQIHHDE